MRMKFCALCIFELEESHEVIYSEDVELFVISSEFQWRLEYFANIRQWNPLDNVLLKLFIKQCRVLQYHFFSVFDSGFLFFSLNIGLLVVNFWWEIWILCCVGLQLSEYYSMWICLDFISFGIRFIVVFNFLYGACSSWEIMTQSHIPFHPYIILSNMF